MDTQTVSVWVNFYHGYAFTDKTETILTTVA